MIALIDIDGTIADCSHRLHFIKHEEPDWDCFFNAMQYDSPIRKVIDLVNVLSKSYKLMFVSGRPESHREMTTKWLQANMVAGGTLFMRKTGDFRTDYIVKRELYRDKIQPTYGAASLAIEDRKRVVDMWRDLGILTLQPRDGDY